SSNLAQIWRMASRISSWSASGAKSTSAPRPLQDVDPAGRADPDDVGQADLGVGDLTVAGLAPEVGGHLVEVGHAGGADGVALGQQPAGDVDRRRPVPPAGPLLDEVGRPALLAEAQVVVVDDLGGGEAVVQLDEVEVGRADAGCLVG